MRLLCPKVGEQHAFNASAVPDRHELRYVPSFTCAQVCGVWGRSIANIESACSRWARQLFRPTRAVPHGSGQV